MARKKKTTKAPTTEAASVDQPKEVRIYDIELEHQGNKLPMKYNGAGQVKEITNNSNHFFEIHMLDEISKLPYRNGICMDIGANVGNHTVFFSRFCNFDEVWAYEPDPGSFELLKENVAKNTSRTVRLFNVAIGEKKGTVKMTDNRDNPCINKVVKGKGDTKILPITTNLKVALMKIDVEGMEIEVVRGAYDVIDRERPELFIEHHGDFDDILKELPKGYRFVRRFNNAPTGHFTSK